MLDALVIVRQEGFQMQRSNLLPTSLCGTLFALSLVMSPNADAQRSVRIDTSNPGSYVEGDPSECSNVSQEFGSLIVGGDAFGDPSLALTGFRAGAPGYSMFQEPQCTGDLTGYLAAAFVYGEFTYSEFNEDPLDPFNTIESVISVPAGSVLQWEIWQTQIGIGFLPVCNPYDPDFCPDTAVEWVFGGPMVARLSYSGFGALEPNPMTTAAFSGFSTTPIWSFNPSSEENQNQNFTYPREIWVDAGYNSYSYIDPYYQGQGSVSDFLCFIPSAAGWTFTGAVSGADPRLCSNGNGGGGGGNGGGTEVPVPGTLGLLGLGLAGLAAVRRRTSKSAVNAA